MKNTISNLESLYGKKIDFFNNDIYYINSKDTLISKGNNYDYTIVMYGHPTECESCLWKLDEWSLKRKEILIHNKNVDFKFILQVEDYESIGHYISDAMPDVPLIYDPHSLFIKNNNLPQDTRFHTFLLNNKNEILLVGSPIGNDKLWDMYKQQIINN